MNYDKLKYRKVDWKHFMMLHWVINPGLVINELILGQRIPKVMLKERGKKQSWVESHKVPCPHCNTIHNGQVWSLQNKTAFKNWFGLYCPSCGGIIPCLMNVTTFVVLVITAPIWYWFKNGLQKKWLSKQPERYKNIDLNAPYIKKVIWWKQGLSWGAIMFVFMTLFEYAQGLEITPRVILGNSITWAIGGLIFGLSMRFMTRKPQEKQNKTQQNN